MVFINVGVVEPLLVLFLPNFVCNLRRMVISKCGCIRDELIHLQTFIVLYTVSSSHRLVQHHTEGLAQAETQELP